MYVSDRVPAELSNVIPPCVHQFTIESNVIELNLQSQSKSQTKLLPVFLKIFVKFASDNISPVCDVGIYLNVSLS